MATSNMFEIGKTYSFNVYGGVIIGNFRNVLVEGIVSYVQAAQVSDIYSRHSSIYGSIPENIIVNNAQSYFYIIVRMSSGERQAVGLPWIIDDTIRVVGNLRANVIIDNVSLESTDDIKRALAANGFVTSSITIE